MNKPRMTFCPTCGKDLEAIMPGKYDRKYRCPECGALHYGKPAKIGKAPACQNCQRIFCDEWREEPLEDWELIPSAEPCSDCQKLTKEAVEAVRSGGVFWRCTDCHTHGALKADHPLAIQVRKQAGIKPPKAVGVEFDKHQCPACNGEMLKTDGEATGLTFTPNQL